MKPLTAESFARRMADKAADDARSEFDRRYRYWSANCQSPIEEIMAAALLYKFGSEERDLVSPWFFGAGYAWPDNSDQTEEASHFYSQAEVGVYRVDFLIRLAYYGEVKFIVIECDGHDFHERTKEQAAHDRRRDRWMAAQGITVLRFTGSEIHRDALACTENVSDVICRLLGWWVPSEAA